MSPFESALQLILFPPLESGLPSEMESTRMSVGAKKFILSLVFSIQLTPFLVQLFNLSSLLLHQRSD